MCWVCAEDWFQDSRSSKTLTRLEWHKRLVINYSSCTFCWCCNFELSLLKMHSTFLHGHLYYYCTTNSSALENMWVTSQLWIWTKWFIISKLGELLIPMFFNFDTLLKWQHMGPTSASQVRFLSALLTKCPMFSSWCKKYSNILKRYYTQYTQSYKLKGCFKSTCYLWPSKRRVTHSD